MDAISPEPEKSDAGGSCGVSSRWRRVTKSSPCPFFARDHLSNRILPGAAVEACREVHSLRHGMIVDAEARESNRRRNGSL